jgi:hypothetical protein
MGFNSSFKGLIMEINYINPISNILGQCLKPVGCRQLSVTGGYSTGFVNPHSLAARIDP